MYKHAGFSHSWSNLLGHSSQKAGITNENRSENDLSTAALEKPQVEVDQKGDAPRHSKRALFKSAFKGSASKTSGNEENQDRDAQNDSEYINNLYSTFGDKQDVYDNFLKKVNTNHSTAEEIYRSDEEEEEEEELDYGKTLKASTLAAIPNNSRNSPPQRVRRRLSQIFFKAEEEADDPATERKCLSLDELPDSGIKGVELGTGSPLPRLTKKKSNLKLASIITTFESFESEIFDLNPSIQNLQLFPSTQKNREGPTTSSIYLPFEWSVWKEK